MTPPKTGTELRREILAMVEGCVCKDRQNTYGDAEDNFANIASIANTVLAGKVEQSRWTRWMWPSSQPASKSRDAERPLDTLTT